MPRAERLLYSALLRMGRRFRHERLPLLGVAGSDAVSYPLPWPAALRRQLENAAPGTEIAGQHVQVACGYTSTKWRQFVRMGLMLLWQTVAVHSAPCSPPLLA